MLLLSIAALLFGILVLFVPSWIRLRLARTAPEETYPATLQKVTFETGLAPNRIFFQREGESKPRVYESTRLVATHAPAPGTPVTVTGKGCILYSFAWDGHDLVQDAPREGAKPTFSDQF